MTTERLAPDAIVELLEMSGVLGDIQDDPDSPDGNWLIASGNNVNTALRASFPSPTGNPAVGADLQEFRALVRQYDEGQGGTPDARVELWEDGGLIRAGPDTPVPDGGIVISLTWNANELGTPAGSLVECRVVGTKSGGSPGNRNSVEVGAVEWNADVSATVVVGAASLDGSGALAGQGMALALGAATAAGAGDLAGSGLAIAPGEASLSGAGQLTAQGTRVADGAAGIAGAGGLAGTPLVIAVAEAMLPGSGSLIGSGTIISGTPVVEGAAALPGSGSLDAVGLAIALATAILQGRGDFMAAGEVYMAELPDAWMGLWEQIHPSSWPSNVEPSRYMKRNPAKALWDMP